MDVTSLQILHVHFHQSNTDPVEAYKCSDCVSINLKEYKAAMKFGMLPGKFGWGKAWQMDRSSHMVVWQIMDDSLNSPNFPFITFPLYLYIFTFYGNIEC